MKYLYREFAKNNDAAVNLYLKHYLIKIGVKKNYNFSDNKIDASLLKGIINV